MSRGRLADTPAKRPGESTEKRREKGGKRFNCTQKSFFLLSLIFSGMLLSYPDGHRHPSILSVLERKMGKVGWKFRLFLSRQCDLSWDKMLSINLGRERAST